jgi:hypothetical protein
LFEEEVEAVQHQSTYLGSNGYNDDFMFDGEMNE